MPHRCLLAAVVFCLLGSVFAQTTRLDPGSFKTSAKFSVDNDRKSLSSAVAIIEPRRGAPGYFWLRIYFYSFAFTPADVQEVSKGNLDTVEKKSRDERKNATAVIQVSVDQDYKVWQVDMSIPGHGCTIAPSEKDVKAFLQSYQFDGKNLTLKSAGSFSCDMSFMKIPNKKYSWEMNLNLPVFEKASSK